MKKRIILCGKAASGKDHLRNMLVETGLVPDVSYTTRPPRDGELDGVAYHFRTEKQFDLMTSANKWTEMVEFNGWKYGTHRQGWEESNVFIMTPSGIESIKEDRSECIVVYLDLPMCVRRKRLEERSDADSAERRMAADEKDFKDFKDYDLKITDPEFDIDAIVDIMVTASYA